jgi:hypothetical protein
MHNCSNSKWRIGDVIAKLFKIMNIYWKKLLLLIAVAGNSQLNIEKNTILYILKIIGE